MAKVEDHVVTNLFTPCVTSHRSLKHLRKSCPGPRGPIKAVHLERTRRDLNLARRGYPFIAVSSKTGRLERGKREPRQHSDQSKQQVSREPKY